MKDSSSIHSIGLVPQKSSVTPVLKDLTPLFWILRAQIMYMVNMHTSRQQSLYKVKLNKNKK